MIYQQIIQGDIGWILVHSLWQQPNIDPQATRFHRLFL